jgi:hypothetical protein
MKIAICYFGTLGGQVFKNNLGGIIPPDMCFKIFKEKIVKSNPECEFDFFIHSWSTTHEKEILNTIKPINFIIEPQKNFMKEAVFNSKLIFDFKDIRPYISTFLRKLFWRSSYNKLSRERISYKFNIYSRWFSTKKVVELKRLYEIKNNIKYDYVFLTRFDVFWHNFFQFKNLKNNLFYSSNWSAPNLFNIKKNYDNRNFQDYWFIANSKMIDIFATLYDYLPDYFPCSHRATYQHAKKMFGKENLSYISYLVKDYELYRRVKKTEINFYE